MPNNPFIGPPQGMPPGLLGPAAPAQGFGARLQGLLGDPTFNLGLGLLSAAGPSPVPMSFGQRLALGAQFANSRQSQVAQNEELRRQMTQRRAMSDLIDGLAADQAGGLHPQQAAFLRALPPEQQAVALGGLLGFGQQQDHGTSFLREAEALGLSTDEARELWKKKQAGANINEQLAAIQANQAALDVEQRREQLAQARRERQQSERSEQEQHVDAQNLLVQDLSRGVEAAQILDSIDSTAVQTGVGQEWRELGVGAIGLIAPEQRALAAQSQRFRQIATDFGVRSLELFRGLGGLTGTEFNAVMGNAMSGDKSPEANRLALADTLEAQLHAADKLQLTAPNRSNVEALIERLRGSGSGGAAPITSPPGARVIDFSQLPD